FLGEISGTPFPDQGKPELSAARDNPVLLAHLVQRAFEEWLSAECDARPVLLILEDLQWIDVPSANLVRLCLRNLEQRRLAIVGLARPETETKFAEMFREAGAAQIDLPDLPESAGRELARAVLGAAPEGLLDAIVRRSAGNVFYLEEL